MKKFVALIVGLSLLAPFAFAQSSSTATGTFEGRVAGRCIVKTPTYNGTLAESDDATDGLPNSLSGTGTFQYRSNDACGQVSNAVVTIAPTLATGSSAPVGTCSADQPVLSVPARANGTTPVTVKASVRATDFLPLVAGRYVLTCTTTISAVN